MSGLVKETYQSKAVPSVKMKSDLKGFYHQHPLEKSKSQKSFGSKNWRIGIRVEAKLQKNIVWSTLDNQKNHLGLRSIYLVTVLTKNTVTSSW